MTSKARNNPAAVLERLIFNNRPAVIILCLLISAFLILAGCASAPRNQF